MWTIFNGNFLAAKCCVKNHLESIRLLWISATISVEDRIGLDLFCLHNYYVYCLNNTSIQRLFIINILQLDVSSRTALSGETGFFTSNSGFITSNFPVSLLHSCTYLPFPCKLRFFLHTTSLSCLCYNYICIHQWEPPNAANSRSNPDV